MQFYKRYAATLLVITIAVFTVPAVTAQEAWDGSNGNLVYNGTGKVGIGTSTPANKLHIRIEDGSVNVPFKMETYGTDSISGISLKNDARNWHIRVDGTDGDKLKFFDASAGYLMVIDPTGKVGIGTPSELPANQTERLYVAGSAHFAGTVSGNYIKAHYQDVAEWVPSNDDLAPGTVVVLDANVGNGVMASSRAYDTSVAGVVSAQPGIILGEEGTDKEQIATTGRVRVKVDASKGPIAVGDLLVTSETEGYAMRSTPIEISGASIHRPGTIVGKALEPLKSGQGEILILLSLQ